MSAACGAGTTTFGDRIVFLDTCGARVWIWTYLASRWTIEALSFVHDGLGIACKTCEGLITGETVHRALFTKSSKFREYVTCKIT